MALRHWTWRHIALFWLAGVALEIAIVLGGRAALDELTMRSTQTLEELPGVQRQDAVGDLATSEQGAVDTAPAKIQVYTWALDSSNATYRHLQRLELWTQRIYRLLPVLLLGVFIGLLVLTALWLTRRGGGGDASRLAAT